MLLKPSLKKFEHNLASMWNESNLYGNLNIFWYYLSLGLEWKLNFSSPEATASFPNYWHGCSALSASSFRTWNSSAGIPSPPLTLFIVMLPKAHLTSHSRMSGSMWVTTPSWLSGLLTAFLYSSSVYSCQLFLISSISVMYLLLLFFTMPIFAWNVPLVSPILLKISLIFPILLFSCFFALFT